MIIGLTGGMVSGKHSLALHLVKKGFIAFAFSDILSDELRKMGKYITRKSQQDLGNEIRSKYGSGELAHRLVLKMDSGNDYVIDGIRNPGEIAELRKQKDFFLIAIDSSREKRFDRLISRSMERDPKTWEEFLKADSRDFDDGNLNGLQITKCMKMADYTIENNGSFDEFIKRFEEIYFKILQKISKNERVSVFIDGSNFYHSLKKLNVYKIDFQKLIYLLVNNRDLVSIKYYNASLDISINKDKYWKQQKFFDYLRKTPLFEVILCKMRKIRKYNKIIDYEVKGDDVHLTVDLISGAYENLYDTAILISGDEDFVPAIKKVQQLSKKVENAYFILSSSNALKNISNESICINNFIKEII